MSVPIPVWAATGLITAPDPTKIAQGWLLAEKPPFEYMNWFQNIVSVRLNDLILDGPASWDATNTYAFHAVTRRNGELFKCLTVDGNINKDPLTNPSDWVQMTGNAAYLGVGTVPNGRIAGSYTGFINIAASGNITAGGIITGNGSGLTNLDASDLATGIVPNARVTGAYTRFTNVTASGTITGGAFVGPATGLTSLNASALTTGIVPNARISGAYSGFTTITTSGNIICGGGISADNFAGPGSNLTALNATNLASGVVANARIQGGYNGFTSITASGTITGGAFSGNGASLTNLNASSLVTGTIAVARLPTESDSSMRGLISRIIASFGGNALSNLAFARDTVNRATGYYDERNGPDLALTNTEEQEGPHLPAGTTWRCLGYAAAGDPGARACIWQRVS